MYTLLHSSLSHFFPTSSILIHISYSSESLPSFISLFHFTFILLFYYSIPVLYISSLCPLCSTFSSIYCSSTSLPLHLLPHYLRGAQPPPPPHYTHRWQEAISSPTLWFLPHLAIVTQVKLRYNSLFLRYMPPIQRGLICFEASALCDKRTILGCQGW